MKICQVLGSISNQNLEKQICKAISLTGITVEEKNLHAFHRMKRRSMVILKFKDCKLRYEVMANMKKLMEKKNESKELHFEESLFLSHFEESLFLSDTMCVLRTIIFFTDAIS